MDIQVARFREVLELLKPVIPRKTSLPVLTNVLLKDGKAVATDLDTMVIVEVPEADINCLIPYASVVKMIQYVQGLENLHIEPKDGFVTLSWSDGSSTFNTDATENFPELPPFVPVVEAPIDIDTLIPAMAEVEPFATSDPARPVLNGVTLIMGEKIAVAAGDGFRMAYKDLPLSFPQENIFIVPKSSVTVLKLLWAKTPRTPPGSDSLIQAIVAKKQASVAFDGQRGLRFVFGDSTTAILKLVEGNPPVWLKLLPKKEPVLQASVMGSQLELAVRRVLSVATAGDNIVRMVFGDDTVIISAKHDGQKTESTVRILTRQGEPNRVALNANYLLDYLKGKDRIVTISWEMKDSPIAFKHQNSPTVVIMPMFVDWDDSAPTPKTEEVEAKAESSDLPTEEVPAGETPPAPPEGATKPPKRRSKKNARQQG